MKATDFPFPGSFTESSLSEWLSLWIGDHNIYDQECLPWMLQYVLRAVATTAQRATMLNFDLRSWTEQQMKDAELMYKKVIDSMVPEPDVEWVESNDQ